MVMKKIKATQTLLAEYYGVSSKTITNYKKGDEKKQRLFIAMKDKYIKDMAEKHVKEFIDEHS